MNTFAEFATQKTGLALDSQFEQRMMQELLTGRTRLI